MTPVKSGALFLGDSITEWAPLPDMFPETLTINYGIGWDTSEGVLLRLNQVTRNSPERIFILIGTNDTRYTKDPRLISRNILEISRYLHTALTNTEIYVISLLPRGGTRNDIVTQVNNILSADKNMTDYVFLDLASQVRAENGEMKPALSEDNLHFNEAGYEVWANTMRDCVKNGCPKGLISINPLFSGQ